MIYVHMAVLLNEIFFPQADPHTAALMTAFAFCSTYILRSFGANPADSVLIKYFTVFKRFTAASFLYAMSRASIYIFTFFGLVYLTGWFDQWGLLLIITPCTFGFLWGVHYFEKLESNDNCLNQNETNNSDSFNWPQKTVNSAPVI